MTMDIGHGILWTEGGKRQRLINCKSTTSNDKPLYIAYTNIRQD